MPRSVHPASGEMKVLQLAADQGGCAFYRLIEPARAVIDAHAIDIEVAESVRVEGIPPHTVTRVDTDADVVVMQRPGDQMMLHILRALQAQGVAVVVEVDDLLSAIPPAHHAYRQFIPSGAARVTEQCAREADMVTASTPALLAHYARHGRGTVIPNAIPRRLAELPPAYEQQRDTVTVGWTGQVGSHPHDLLDLGSGLRQAFDHVGDRARFAAWSPTLIAEQTGVTPQRLRFEKDVEDYVASIGRHLDVGIAPLRDDQFNRAKSWLKPLEYAARGVLPISSRMGEYMRLGIGPTAKRPHDWATLITRAVTDDDWRREQAAAARQRVLDAHLTEHTAHLWVGAWKQAADNRTRTVAA